MSNKVISLQGQQADYDLRLIPTEAGQTPVLVGISGPAKGDVHQLTGAEAVEFADQRLELKQTGLIAAKPPATNLPLPQQTLALNGEDLTEEAADTSAPASTQRIALKAAVDPSNYSANTPSVAPTVSTPSASPAQVTPATEPPEPTSTPDKSTPAPLSLPLQSAPVSASAAGWVELRLGALADITSPPEPSLIQGTAGPDNLWGTAGPDTIDGLLNVDFSGAFFSENLQGNAGDDQLFYRGFFGDTQRPSKIEATVFGGDGNDTVSTTLDGATQTQVDGGSGFNTLVVQAAEAPFNPWHTDYMEWSWVGPASAPTLQGLYISPLHSQASVAELSASFQSIASGNSSPLNLVRPDALNPDELVGSKESDFLLAANNTQWIQAGDGNDTVIARANNTVSLGSGINTLYAYSSNVTLDYSDSAHAVNLNLANKMGLMFDETSQIYAVDRLMSDIQHVNGSRLSDTLTGNHLNNTLRTGGGSDELRGGAAADTFIIDIENNTNAARILDFNIGESDQLVLNLSQWTSPNNPAVGQYQIVGDDAQVWGRGSVTNEESALLSVLISQNTQTIQLGFDGQYQTAVRFDHPIDHWTPEDWTSILTIDYL
jgi:Ca2+-binding RTX toxin-like protein